MRYLVISDLHGDAAAITKALSYFDKYNCDQLVTLGDILNHPALAIQFQISILHQRQLSF